MSGQPPSFPGRAFPGREYPGREYPGRDGPDRPKRFYATVATVESAGGWGVTLDGRPLRTPARAELTASRAIAEAVAAEWEAQTETIDPAAMPVTRTVNSAIDRVAPQRAAVIDDIAAYGGSDLLCYRADRPAELAERQRVAWDPVLDWAARELGARLILVEGVIHAAQSQAALDALRSAVEGAGGASGDIRLAALHELTTLSGSAVLALAVDHGWLEPAAAWAASRVDEDWQIEQWGRDEEAAAMAARKERDFLTAARIAALLRGD